MDCWLTQIYAESKKKMYVCIIFASLQRIRSTVDETEQKQLLMDLDVVMRSNDCQFIVKFYGALFKEVCYSAFISLYSFTVNFLPIFCL